MIEHLLELFPITSLTAEQFYGLAPLMFLLALGLLNLFFAAASENFVCKKISAIFPQIGLVVAFFIFWNQLGTPEVLITSGHIVIKDFHRVMSMLLIVCAGFTFFISQGYEQQEDLPSELYSLGIFSLIGMMLMIYTQNLIFIFIALEIMSLAVYVLVGMRRHVIASAEASLKYFILGGLASGLLLYGSALLFGTTGSFDLSTISAQLSQMQNIPMIFYVGSILVLCGFLFKIGAFPFHQWVPDVYQGASHNITAFMSTAVKLTSFIVLVNFAQKILLIDATDHFFVPILWAIAAITMLFGNILAISQAQIKRLLAYSTIAHTGYLLLALLALKGSPSALHSLFSYLIFYVVMNFSAFAVVILLSKTNDKDLAVTDFIGLAHRKPILGTVMAVSMAAMAGIPLTSGFVGKFMIFSSAIEAGLSSLVLIAVLASAIGVTYYFKIIAYIFMKPTQNEKAVSRWGGSVFCAVVGLILTIQLGVLPKSLLSHLQAFLN
jgi:NADH-quinone oxidoreductase subunit N